MNIGRPRSISPEVLLSLVRHLGVAARAFLVEGAADVRWFVVRQSSDSAQFGPGQFLSGPLA